MGIVRADTIIEGTLVRENEGFKRGAPGGAPLFVRLKPIREVLVAILCFDGVL